MTKKIKKNKFTITTIALFLAIVVMSSASSAEAFGGNGQRQNSNNQTIQNQVQQLRQTSSFWTNGQFDTTGATSYIQELMQLLSQLEKGSSVVQASEGIHVLTQKAIDVEEDEATLASLLRNIDDGATIWFEYGEDRSDLDQSTNELSIDEDDEGDVYEKTITSLDEGTRYYFRIVAEDEDGKEIYGSILSFATDVDSDEYEPEAVTEEADDLSEDSAELNGSVDMNDFSNGYVFFVYGQDEDSVEDAGDEDSYSDIIEDGEELQKDVVDSDLDSTEDFTLDIDDLDDDTTYYFRIAVEYENEDGDTVIVFGDVESFTTDED